MANLSRVLRCNRCGKVLQCDNPNKDGYIREDVFKYHGDRILYCEKCYEEKMINASMLVSGINESVFHILEDAVASDALVIYVIDLTAFNGVIKNELIKKLKKINVLVIANKRDLLPEKVKEETIKDFVMERFKVSGITPKDMIVVSASKGYKIDQLKASMEELRNKRDVYMIGSEICGKTTIINKLLMNYENKTRRTIQRITYPGTNLRILSIPLDNSSNLYELPGFNLNDSVLGIVEKQLANKYIIPKEPFKPRKFKLGKDESLIVGGLAAFTNKSNNNFEIQAYFSNQIELKKVSESKLEMFIKTNLIKRELRPVSDRLQTFENFDLYQYDLDVDDNKHEIGIKGLGWISFKPKGQKIYVMLPRNAHLMEGKSRV